MMILLESNLAPRNSMASQYYPRHLEPDCLFTALEEESASSAPGGVGPGGSWALWSCILGE